MKARLSVVLLVVVLVAADAPESDAVKTEMKKLEGTWRGVSATSNGKAVPDEQVTALSMTIKADGTWVMSTGKEETGTGTFTVDPAKKPRIANFVIKSGKYKDQTTLDIYELDGDTLKFCYVLVPTGKEQSKERPTKFESEAGSGHLLWVMKREKAK